MKNNTSQDLILNSQQRRNPISTPADIHKGNLISGAASTLVETVKYKYNLSNHHHLQLQQQTIKSPNVVISSEESIKSSSQGAISGPSRKTNSIEVNRSYESEVLKNKKLQVFSFQKNVVDSKLSLLHLNEGTVSRARVSDSKLIKNPSRSNLGIQLISKHSPTYSRLPSKISSTPSLSLQLPNQTTVCDVELIQNKLLKSISQEKQSGRNYHLNSAQASQSLEEYLGTQDQINLPHPQINLAFSPQVPQNNRTVQSLKIIPNPDILMSQQQLTAEDSFILYPASQPTENSYYDILEHHKVLEDILAKNEIPGLSGLSFKTVFETQKHLIPSQTSKISTFLMQQAAQILKQSSSRKKSMLGFASTDSAHSVPQKDQLAATHFLTPYYYTLPELLAEKSQKHSEELDRIQNLYKEQIKNLRQRIHKLEIDKQQQECALRQSRMEMIVNDLNVSQFQYSNRKSQNELQYFQEENFLLKNRLQKQQTLIKKNIVPVETTCIRLSESASQFYDNNNFDFMVQLNKSQQNIQEPRGRVIEEVQFGSGTELVRLDTKIKKTMLKTKELAYKDQDIEIGLISSKEIGRVRVLVYIQTEKGLFNVSVKATTQDPSKWDPKCEIVPSHPFRKLNRDKQEKVSIVFEEPEVHELPSPIIFLLVLYQLWNYQVNSRINQTAAPHQLRIPLATSFHRFVTFSEMADIRCFQDQFRKAEDDIIRTSEFIYSRKILKDHGYLRNYLPKLRLLNPEDQTQFYKGRACMKYGATVQYSRGQIKLLLRIVIKPNEEMYIQVLPVGKGKDSLRVGECLLDSLYSIFCRGYM